jgi:type I restriction enzyme S subunit
MKDITSYVNRGQAPKYVDVDEGPKAFGQRCVQQNRDVDPIQGRPIASFFDIADSPDKLSGGDIVVNSTGTGTLGRAGYITESIVAASGPLIADGHVTVIRALSEAALPRFLWYALSTETFYEIANVCIAVGATNQMELGRESLRRLGLRVPSIDEQTQLVRYLDHKMSQIDNMMAEQLRQQALLDEHRFAATSAAVGSRLAGNPGPLQSGLDAMPDGWTATPLRYLASIQSGVTLGKKYDEECIERPYLRVANVRDGSIDLDEVTSIMIPPEVAVRHELRAGDVLMTEGNGNPENLGRGAMWDGSIEGCLHQNHLFALRPDTRRLRPKYLVALLASSWGRSYFSATSHQVGIATTNRSKVGGCIIPLPSVKEQDRILRDLDELVSRVEQIRGECQRQIDLLKEHREALITAALTGQVQIAKSAA